MTPEELTFLLAAGGLICSTVIALAKIYFLHVNPNNGNGTASKT